MSILRIVRYISVYPQHFKLFRAIFIKECNGNAHNAIVAVWYLRRFIYIDSVVLVVLRIFVRAVLNVKVNRLVALLNVHVGKPADVTHSPPLLPSLIHFEISSLWFIVIGDTKPKMSAVYEQGEILFHQGEGWICHYNIAFFQQGQTLRGTEVAAALQGEFSHSPADQSAHHGRC